MPPSGHMDKHVQTLHTIIGFPIIHPGHGPPAGSFLPPKATTSKKSHAATDMTHRVQVVPQTINKLCVFSLSAILHVALLSGQLIRPNSVPVLN